MSQSAPVKSHPLDLTDQDEDEKCTGVSKSASFTRGDNKLNLTLEGLMRRRPDKPIAPKRPDPPKQALKLEDKQINFFIEIGQVRWFYKGDKDSTANNGLSTPTGVSQTSLPSIQSSSNMINPDQSSHTLNENDINNNNNNNSNMSSVNLNTKKWYKFSKVDSFNLEIEYRDMISKKVLNANSEVNFVQVLNNLYEVNLESKKCYPIYWKAAKTMSVMRCIWYTDSGEPFDERIGELIERKHIELFRDQLGNENDNSINGDLQVRTPSPTENNEDLGPKCSKNELVKSVEINANYSKNRQIENSFQ
ncbi:phospholipase DDHD1 [Brachionus plicatilis]|uniref:Phospholipase DDHD1 n=1 Tax=Brachionus plicatilis TaxID=10195 RepID=A0A3M7SEG7_BRAPC|nr:phospholipase DDHD1 [Brachionus plicatilis]